jgi:hypothetical protein
MFALVIKKRGLVIGVVDCESDEDLGRKARYLRSLDAKGHYQILRFRKDKYESVCKMIERGQDNAI